MGAGGDDPTSGAASDTPHRNLGGGWDLVQAAPQCLLVRCWGSPDAIAASATRPGIIWTASCRYKYVSIL